MKKCPILLASISTLLAIQATPTVHAATLTWDNGAATGNWNTTDANWTGSIWNNGTPDDAIFNNLNGTVTLTEAITGGSLTYNNGGAPSGAHELTLTGSSLSLASILSWGGYNPAGGGGGVDDISQAYGQRLRLQNINVTTTGNATVRRGMLYLNGATLNVGGVINAADAWSVFRADNSTVTATGGIDLSVIASQVELYGGTVTTSFIKVGNAAFNGTGGLTMGGGVTLVPTGASSDYLAVFNNGDVNSRAAATISSGGMTIDTAYAVTISTALNGGGSFAKAGTGTLTLSGANSFSGVTNINAGTLLATSSTALGVGGHNGATMSFIQDGATLALQGGISLDEHFHVWGAGVGGLGAVRSISGNNALTNAPGGGAGYALRSNTTVGVDADTLTVSGFYDGDGGDYGLIKIGAGTLKITALSNHGGGTTVNAGLLEVAGSSGGNGYIIGTATVNAGAEIRYTGGDGSGFGYQSGNKIDTLNINGGLVDSQSIAHVWNATVNMTAGELRVNGGVSAANAGNYFEWGNTAVNTFASNATATISGRIRIRPDASPNVNFTVADGGAATDLLVSAAITETGASGITKLGLGTMALTGANSYSGVTVLAGGTLNVASVSDYGAAGSLGNRSADSGGNVGLLFRGGTLQYTGATAQSTNRAIRVSTTGGGATIDASGSALSATLSFTAATSPDFFENGGSRTLTLTGSNIGNNTFGMAIGEVGGVTDVVKNGAGKWVLAGANTYSGDTTINAGTLEVGGTAGTIGTGNVVNNSALIFNRSTAFTVGGVISGPGTVAQSGAGTVTLAGTNTYTGATTVTAGGLDLTGSLTSNVGVTGGGLSGEGSTTGTLTFTGASTLAFDPSTPGTYLSAASANATGATVTLIPLVSMAGTGIVVFEALGGITGTAGGGGNNFVFTGRGLPYLNGPSGMATQLLFDFTPGSVVWKGDDGTNPTFWDVGATTNWRLSGSPDQFLVGDSVTFDDTANTYNVVVQGVSAITGGVTFNNTTTYTVSGGAIAGSGTFTKNNSGTVILKAAHTFTGATTINAGTLQLGDGTVGNDGSLATSGIINDGTLAYNLNGNQTAGYAIDGTGALIKTGAGTLTLTAGSSYSGGTTVNGGILKAGNANALGDWGAAITVNTGAALDINAQNLQAYTSGIVLNGTGINASTGALFNSGAQQLNGIRFISLGSDTAIGSNGGRFDLGRNYTDTVNLGNGHVLTKIGSNTVAILNSSAGFSGVVINGGTLTAEKDDALDTAPITINSGGALGSYGGRTLGNLITLGGAATVDPEGGNLTLTGSVSGAGSLSKIGGNTLYLTGNNTQTGTLSINGGHVHFASASGYATQGNVVLVNPVSFLLMDQPNQFGPNSGLLFNSSGGHNEFALYGNDQTIASLASTNQFAVVQNAHGGFGPASASSTLTVNQSTDTTYSGVFRDNTGTDAFTLALVKTGSGKLTLATNTEYTGGTTVNGGVLEITGSSGGNGNLRGTVTVNSGGELRYTSGDGTGFGYNGGNKIDTLNINGGLVDLQQSSHLWSATLNMTGGELRVNGGVSEPGGNVNQWNYVSTNTLASASTATISGHVRLRGDGGFTSASFTVADGAATIDLLFSAAVTEQFGSVGIAKNGAGTMAITGANSYSGATDVNVGTLVAANAAALGSTTSGTSVSSSATLDVQANIGSEALSVGGTGVGGNGALMTSTGTGTVGGTVTLTGATSIGAGSSATLNINGTVAAGANALTTVGTGVTSFGTASTLTSLTSLTAADGTANVNSALGTGGSAVVGVTDTAGGNPTVLRFGTVSQTLSSLSIGAGSTVVFTSGLASGALTGGGGKGAGLGGGAIVPEPGTLGLLLAGTLGLLGRRRRGTTPR